MGAGGDASLAEKGQMPHNAQLGDSTEKIGEGAHGHASIGIDRAAAGKAKQLMNAVDPSRMLLVDFNAITAEVTSGTGATPLIPKWMMGQRENPDKPSMRKVQGTEFHLATRTVPTLLLNRPICTGNQYCWRTLSHLYCPMLPPDVPSCSAHR